MEKSRDEARAEHAITDERSSTATPSIESWPEVPAVPGPPDPEPLPLDVLPRVIRDHVVSVAGATQTPADMGTMLALAAVSATIAGRGVVVVDARAWHEPLNIYVSAIQPPASRKSPVFEHMTAPISEWEREMWERNGEAYRRARDRVDVAAVMLEAAKKEVGRGKKPLANVDTARQQLDAAERAVPPLARILASDATPEALVRLMAETGGRIALLSPEADPLGIADGRYSDRARIDELLRAWSGEAIRVDRVSREPIQVPRPALTLAICAQPEALMALQHRRVHRGRGLWGRMLWVQPPHGLGTRKTGRGVPPLDAVAAGRYACVLRVLLTDSGSSVRADQRATLALSAEALDLLYGFEGEVERELADGGRWAGIRDWAGKMCGQAVRLAALMELAARADDGGPLWAAPVSPWAMKGAIRLVEALATHAIAVLDEAGMDRRTADAQYVLGRALALPEGSSERDLHRATRDRPGLGRIEDLRPVLTELEERGCVRVRAVVHNGPGRPASPTVELHPALRKPGPTLADRQNRQNTNTLAPGPDSVGFVRGSCRNTRDPALLAQAHELLQGRADLTREEMLDALAPRRRGGTGPSRARTGDRHLRRSGTAVTRCVAIAPSTGRPCRLPPIAGPWCHIHEPLDASAECLGGPWDGAVVTLREAGHALGRRRRGLAVARKPDGPLALYRAGPPFPDAIGFYVPRYDAAGAPFWRWVRVDARELAASLGSERAAS